jgi:hypothetical protein
LRHVLTIHVAVRIFSRLDKQFLGSWPEPTVIVEPVDLLRAGKLIFVDENHKKLLNSTAAIKVNLRQIAPAFR